jgi:hypothetical protein
MLRRVDPDDPAIERTPRWQIEEYTEEERMEIEKLNTAQEDPKPHCGLRVEIENGDISIRLPISVLRMAVYWSPELSKYDPEGGEHKRPTITDAKVFAGEVVRALRDEGEDGSTIVTRMFDTAFCDAIDNGADGIHFPGDDDE